MSEPVVFCLIRDGHKRFYADRWASVFLHRELLFGPQDFEAWVTQLEDMEEDDEWSDEFSAGAVADYDRKKLIWRGDVDALQIPRVAAIYQRLLEAAWPGFEVAFAFGNLGPWAEAIGIDRPGEPHDEYRPETVLEAARSDNDEEEDETLDDEEAATTFDDEENRAWVTIVDADGAVRHRHLEHLPADLLNDSEAPRQALAGLPPAEVPPEAVVVEGMWIDERNRSVGLWGSRRLHDKLPEIRRAWEGWSVEWAQRGYDAQCEVAGPAGVPMTEAEALAKILPAILSTKRFDMSTVLGALGGGLKKTAMKATGCLLVLICLPLVVFGLVSGTWKPVLISIAITCGVVIVVFKVIERRVKRSFMNKMPRAVDDRRAPPAAGPLEPSARRDRIDQLLAAAGLPTLAAVEPLFPEKSELNLLD